FPWRSGCSPERLSQRPSTGTTPSVRHWELAPCGLRPCRVAAVVGPRSLGARRSRSAGKSAVQQPPTEPLFPRDRALRWLATSPASPKVAPSHRKRRCSIGFLRSNSLAYVPAKPASARQSNPNQPDAATLLGAGLLGWQNPDQECAQVRNRCNSIVR